MADSLENSTRQSRTEHIIWNYTHLATPVPNDPTNSTDDGVEIKAAVVYKPKEVLFLAVTFCVLFVVGWVFSVMWKYRIPPFCNHCRPEPLVDARDKPEEATSGRENFLSVKGTCIC